jgi:hypothetical protein
MGYLALLNSNMIPALALSLALSPRAREPEFEALLLMEKGLG